MRYLLSLTVVLTVFFSSCTKDPGPLPGGSSKGKLARIIVGNDTTNEFFYNSGGQLVRWVSYIARGIKSSEVVRTYSNNQVVREDRLINFSSSLTTPSYDTSYTLFSYNSNGLLRQSDNHTKSGYVSVAANSYNAQNQLTETVITSPGGQFYSRVTYAYNAAGNVLTEELYNGSSAASATISSRTTYEYDNKANPYLNIWTMPYGVNPNNITKRTVKNFLQPGQPVTVSVTTYQGYNADGFPLQQTDNGVVFTYQYYQ